MELIRDGPGLLLRDILKGEDPQVAAVVEVLAKSKPDVLLLTAIDWDYDGAALSALTTVLAAAGQDYPHLLSPRPNAGLMTALDLDGDGRRGGPGDAQGWGRFLGSGGMALLSKHPLRLVENLSDRLWADLPGVELPLVNNAPFPSAEAYEVQRLSSVGHWDVALAGLRLLAFSAGPPVFDGPEDRNGLRNAAEIALWQEHLATVEGPVVVIGNANLDPLDGDGRREAIGDLLAHPRLQDPKPRSPGGAASGAATRGDPGLHTADWPEEGGPGNLRVSYVLPSRDVPVVGAGVVWPVAGDLPVATASRHRLVWVDIERP